MGLGLFSFTPNFLPDGAFHCGERPPSQSRKGLRKSSPEKGAGADIIRVLIFGRIRELALYRAEVLRNRGFSVIVPATREEAREAIEHAEFDVAVLTYTLSSETVEELSELLRQKCPTCPLITITNSHKVDGKIRPDRLVLADQGPEALIKALKAVMKPQ